MLSAQTLIDSGCALERLRTAFALLSAIAGLM